MMEKKQMTDKPVENECLNYNHDGNYPDPESASSCRGCRHSYDPSLYDGGCLHPIGYQPRQQQQS